MYKLKDCWGFFLFVFLQHYVFTNCAAVLRNEHEVVE